MRSLVGNNGSQPIFLVATSISCEDFLERSSDHLSWAHKVNWDQMHGWIDASWQHLATQPATFGGKTHHCAKPVLACMCVCVHAYVQIQYFYLFILCFQRIHLQPSQLCHAAHQAVLHLYPQLPTSFLLETGTQSREWLSYRLVADRCRERTQLPQTQIWLFWQARSKSHNLKHPDWCLRQ